MTRIRVVSLGSLVVALWAAVALVWLDVWPTSGGAALPAPPTYTPPVVEVTDGVDVDRDEAAAVIAAIVNDPRGWRTDLNRFTVRIVPPGTRGADGLGALIGRAFVDERLAIVTADAWTTLGPKFAAVGGTLDEQRTWIVLHELGHLLGHDHVGCPGSGPAPIMRLTTYGLDGCDLNVWPHPDITAG